MTKCLACGADVDTSKPAGWSGRHRYGCIGPSTWTGLLANAASSGRPCWCGQPGVIQISRGLSDLYACSPAHARKRAVARTARVSAFAPFVLACYPKGVGQ